MDKASVIPPPKGRIAARFGRAVDSYEAGAGVQMEILRRAADLIGSGMGAGELWCDAGSGSGTLPSILTPLPDGTRFVCLDLSAPPLRRALRLGRTRLAVAGDVEFPPFRSETFDGAAALSMLQWVSSPKNALRNIAQLLKTGGMLYFSVFADGSFSEIVELRQRMGLSSAVWLPTADEFSSALKQAGFETAGEIEFFDRVVRFSDAASAVRSLNRTGATASAGKLLNRAELNTLLKDYTRIFSDGETVPLTYRAIIGKARKKAE